MAKFRFSWDPTKLERALRFELDGITRADTQRRARQVQRAAKQNVSTMTRNPSGQLESSIRFATAHTTRGWLAQIGSDLPYALYVHEGTGIYGPDHHLITPPPGVQAFKFPVRSSRGNVRRFGKTTTVVFIRSSRGQPPKPYLTNAIDAYNP